MGKGGQRIEAKLSRTIPIRWRAARRSAGRPLPGVNRAYEGYPPLPPRLGHPADRMVSPYTLASECGGRTPV